MGFLDKAKELVNENKDRIRQGIDLAEDQARKYAPIQHGSKVAKAAEMARKGVDKVDPTTAESTADPSAAGEPKTGETEVDQSAGPTEPKTGGAAPDQPADTAVPKSGETAADQPASDGE